MKTPASEAWAFSATRLMELGTTRGTGADKNRISSSSAAGGVSLMYEISSAA
ncbi:MAG: hypothetical protein JF599_02695 [Verrucomicrobia bacterium]|nr:hypothetical protein [Verrucomicrobiota bacterium]